MVPLLLGALSDETTFYLYLMYYRWLQYSKKIWHVFHNWFKTLQSRWQRFFLFLTAFLLYTGIVVKQSCQFWHKSSLAFCVFRAWVIILRIQLLYVIWLFLLAVETLITSLNFVDSNDISFYDDFHLTMLLSGPALWREFWDLNFSCLCRLHW